MKKIGDEQQRHQETLNNNSKENRQRYNSMGSTRMTITSNESPPHPITHC
jgi:hypothetical protein